jgi:hypothetical protein
MRAVDLALVYGLVGVACAIAIARAELAEAAGGDARALRAARISAAWNAVCAVALWPLWAPLALTRPTRAPARLAQDAAPNDRADPRVARASAALEEAARASAGTPFEALLSCETAARISGQLARAAARQAEVEALLVSPGYDVGEAAARVASLESERASPRTLATARLHLENVRRLVALRDRDARALEELGELAHALRAQLAVARLAGSSGAEASDIVAEVWSRIEGLDAANEGLEACPSEAAP